MTQTNTNNPLQLKAGSVAEEVYKQYLANSNSFANINHAELAQRFDCTKGNIRAAIKKIRKKIAIYSGQLNVPLPPTSPTNTTSGITINIKPDDAGDLCIFIKTCEEFENWLKVHKEVRETSNLWGQGSSGKFYHLKIVDNYSDDINSPIITRDVINFAILRIPGISQGLKFKIDGLLSEESLISGVKKLISTFSSFYKKTIYNHQINIQGSLEIQNGN